MTTVSSEVAEKTRKYRALVLQAVARVGQEPIGTAIGVSGSTVSRFTGEKEDEGMMRALGILAAAGLKVVPAEMQCFPPRKVQILMELARDHLNLLETTEQLQWD